MTPIGLIWSLAAGSLFAMAVIELAVARMTREPRVHVAFSVVALAAMAGVLTEAATFGTTSVAVMTVLVKRAVTFNILAHLGLIAFTVQYADARFRWPGWLAVGVFGAAGIVHLALPAGITLNRIEAITVATLPWGGRIALPVGSPHPIWPLSFAAVPVLLLFLGDVVVQTARGGDLRRARRLTVMGAILFLAFVQGFLSDALLVPLPGLSSISFLAILGLTGEDLVRDVVRAAALAKDVAARERRWQDLIANVQVAVLGLTPDGRIDWANPFFEHLVGRPSAVLRGRSVLDSVVPGQRQAVADQLESLRAGGGGAHAEWTLGAADGTERTVAWSTIRRTAEDRTVTGFVSVGVDVTEHSKSEARLKQALREVTRLRDQLESENINLREELRADLGFNDIVGDSNALRYVLNRVQQVAATDLPVLLEGETGVGKELIARAIVDRSPRRQGPFIRVNCAAIPATLVESELFGHERGAFTGADKQRRGRFELADGGTLFLDEIGDLPLELQSRLLRVLEDGEFTRLGGEAAVRADVRLVVATNRVLRDEVAAGRFREDLYFRLSTFVLTVPPLRDRAEDIPLLVSHFVAEIARKRGKTIDQIPRAVMDRLMGYRWPGNVRELQNVLERAVLLSPGPELRLADRLDGSDGPRAGARAAPHDPLGTLEQAERRHIERALGHSGGRVGGRGGAAELLGVNPSTLRSRMKKLGIRSHP